jgi:type IV pilus assembly protein PilW
MIRTSLPSRAAQTGFTLIELMVSLVIGLAVVGALLAAYYASFTSSRHSDAMTQIAEDATLALNVIRAQVAQAGYRPAQVTGLPPNETLAPPLFKVLAGCKGANFTDPNAANGAAACNATVAGASDAIEVAYDSTPFVAASGGSMGNGVLVGGQPVDCLGNTFALDPVTGGYLNDSRFYVKTGTDTLYCHGPSGEAPLVDHVTNLQIKYGIAKDPWGTPDGKTSQILYYRDAPTPLNAVEWKQIAAINICVDIRSADKVIDQTTPELGAYFDCSDAPQTPTDGYVHRTFTTTVLLQNVTL